MNNNFDLIPTNSFINGDFNILALDVEEDPFTDVLKPTAINMEESNIVNFVEFINKLNEFYTNNKIKLYDIIKESNNDVIILEGFSDYYVQMDALISKYLKFIKYKIDDFVSTIKTFIDENKIISEHKKALLEEIKYYIDDSSEGFEYTIDESIPNVSVLDNFNTSLFDDLFKPMVNDLSVESIQQTISSIDLEQDFSVVRGKLLNNAEPLSIQEFNSMMYSIFRNGETSKKEFNLDAKSIKDIAKNWFDNYNIKSLLYNDYNAIEKSLDNILNKIKTLTKNNNNMSISAFTDLLPGDIKSEKIDGQDINNNGSMMSSDMMLQINIYTKAKLDQLQGYTDMIAMILGAKMDAIRSMVQQDRSILLNAIEVLDKPDVYYDARRTSSASNLDEAKFDKNFDKAANKAKKGPLTNPKDIINITKPGLDPENLKDAAKGVKNIIKNKKKSKYEYAKYIDDIRAYNKYILEGLFDGFNKNRQNEKQRQEYLKQGEVLTNQVLNNDSCRNELKKILKVVLVDYNKYIGKPLYNFTFVEDDFIGEFFISYTPDRIEAVFGLCTAMNFNIANDRNLNDKLVSTVASMNTGNAKKYGRFITYGANYDRNTLLVYFELNDSIKNKLLSNIGYLKKTN